MSRRARKNRGVIRVCVMFARHVVCIYFLINISVLAWICAVTKAVITASMTLELQRHALIIFGVNKSMNLSIQYPLD